ncbi:hypothetical protein BJV82DRAFT_628303 [Fennellomyces sp. T-0311]|nr:hypothetical protein BJV82DRAFT_628303 [Fennellomyces sp. T-0311]
MRSSVFLAFLAILVSAVSALKEPPKTLQIGVKKRIPDEECTARSRDGDVLSMHYTGTLFDTGAKFDSSVDRNQPLEFSLGTGQVIKGWDQGLKNMCVGEKRRLVIPPEWGYGAKGAGSAIPGGATLVFEVELMGIKPGARSFGAKAEEESQAGFLETIDVQSPTFIAGAATVLLAIGWVLKRAIGGSQKAAPEKKEEKKADSAQKKE